MYRDSRSKFWTSTENQFEKFHVALPNQLLQENKGSNSGGDGVYVALGGVSRASKMALSEFSRLMEISKQEYEAQAAQVQR